MKKDIWFSICPDDATNWLGVLCSTTGAKIRIAEIIKAHLVNSLSQFIHVGKSKVQNLKA